MFGKISSISIFPLQGSRKEIREREGIENILNEIAVEIFSILK